jgi:uncharacterized protein YdhG (YjbR/CyaY superfamily)
VAGKADKPKNTDDYIATFPPKVQELLQETRATIQKAAPDAEEAMGYGVPAFKLNGYLVYYAAFKKHIGFYPTPSGMKAFADELEAYETAKGTVKFPLDKPMPFDLIARIVAFRVSENAS